jgi:hypothetical protein
VALGSTIALLLTNHWYMVHRGLRRLRMPLRQYAKSVWLPCLLAFPAVLGILQSVRRLAGGSSAVGQLGAVTSAAAVVFGLALWRLVLSPAERARLTKFVRFAAGGLRGGSPASLGG